MSIFLSLPEIIMFHDINISQTFISKDDMTAEVNDHVLLGCLRNLALRGLSRWNIFWNFKLLKWQNLADILLLPSICVYFKTKKKILGYNYYFLITAVQETGLCIWTGEFIELELVLVLTAIKRVFMLIHLTKLFSVLIVCSLWLWSFCYKCALFSLRKPLKLKYVIVLQLSYQNIRRS